MADARKRTRCPESAGIGDADLLRQLCAFAAGQNRAVNDAALGPLLEEEASRLLRAALVATLTHRYALEKVVADACARAGITGCEPQVSYCLVVLCQKDDPARSRSGQPRRRTYALDIGTDGFEHQLSRWAGEIASHMSTSSEKYRRICEEAERYEIGTLRRLMPISPRDSRDDIADTLADKLAGIVAGQRLEDMNLDTACSEEPRGSEYVFQSPLGRWVMTSAMRALGPDFDELPGDGRSGEPADEANETAQGYDVLVKHVSALAGTRRLLSEAIAQGRNATMRALVIAVADVADAALFRSFRAELEFILDGLCAEQRLFGQMLAYVVLAMSMSPKRHMTAILSLRADWLDAQVREHIAGRMHALVTGENGPMPALIMSARAATRKFVPANRAAELERLRDRPRHRAAVFARLGTLLNDLPAIVGGSLGEIAAAAPGTLNSDSVRAMRNQAATELAAVDRVFGRSFRRYAMRDHGLN